MISELTVNYVNSHEHEQALTYINCPLRCLPAGPIPMKVVQLSNPYAASLELQLNRVSKGLKQSSGTRKYVSSCENGGLVLAYAHQQLNCWLFYLCLDFVFKRAFTIKIKMII